MRKTSQRKRKTRVCMVAYTDYVFDARVRREAETLASNGFEVLCLQTQHRSGPRRYDIKGVQIRELRVPKYQGKSRPAYLFSYLRFLVAASTVCLGLLLKRRLDVVHVHNLPDFLVLAGLLPRLAGRKVVLDVHDSMPETFATKFSKSPVVGTLLCLEERLSASVAHRVICVNEPQRDKLVTRGISRDKTFVSMNVPDPAIFERPSPAESRPCETSEQFNVVYHGTMAERLGVDLIIRAVALTRGRIPAIRLHLWGGGDDLSSFRALARELDVLECTTFNPDGFHLEELPSQLRPMHLGVVGNRRSPASDLMLPVKLMEYVTLGIPAVVPRLDTIEHYFTDEMVSYYEPDNVDSFAATICRAYEQPGLRRQQAERARRFLDDYGWERQGPEFLDFYRKLVGSTHG